MSQPKKPKKKDEGQGQGVPPERWSVEPPFDSAVYLDGEPPSYEGDAEPKGGEQDAAGTGD